MFSSLCYVEGVFVFFLVSVLQVGFQVRLLAASKDVHRGRVFSHVGGCEVAGLNFPLFCGFVRCLLWA